MSDQRTIAITDYFKLAILDLFKVLPMKVEHQRRYVAYFKLDEVSALLMNYDTGNLKVNARDFVAAIQRVKDRIFESERLERGGIEYEREKYPARNQRKHQPKSKGN